MIKSLLYLAILTAVTVVSWIGFSVHHSYTASTIDDATEIRITPIPGEFDRETIEKIKNKRIIDADLGQELIIVSITPDPDDESTATPEADIEL